MNDYFRTIRLLPKKLKRKEIFFEMISFPGTKAVVRTISSLLVPATLMALAVVLAVPAHAGGNREVKARVAPVYPELAKRMKITGAVKVEAVVDADGKVTTVKSLSGNRMLEVAAEDAVKRWKFETASASSTEEVSINFE
jgi:TonB family protein